QEQGQALRKARQGEVEVSVLVKIASLERRWRLGALGDDPIQEHAVARVPEEGNLALGVGRDDIHVAVAVKVARLGVANEVASEDPPAYMVYRVDRKIARHR